MRNQREIVGGIAAVVGSVAFYLWTKRAAPVVTAPVSAAPLVIDPSVYQRTAAEAKPAVPLESLVENPESHKELVLAPHELPEFGIDSARNNAESELDEYNALPLERSGLTYETRVRFEDVDAPQSSTITQRFSWFRFTVLKTRENGASPAIGGLAFFQGLREVSHPDAKTWNPHTGESRPFKGDSGFEGRVIRIRFPMAVAIDRYRIRTSLFDRDQDPTAWRLEGSQNGIFWVTLDERELSPMSVPFARGVWALYLLRV
jgi:hypothetical protein